MVERWQLGGLCALDYVSLFRSSSQEDNWFPQARLFLVPSCYCLGQFPEDAEAAFTSRLWDEVRTSISPFPSTSHLAPATHPALPADILAADLDFVQPIDLWTQCTMDHIELFHGPCGYFTLMVGNKLEKVLVLRL
jgi:hypothetical protein